MSHSFSWFHKPVLLSSPVSPTTSIPFHPIASMLLVDYAVPAAGSDELVNNSTSTVQIDGSNTLLNGLSVDNGMFLR